MNIIYKIIKTKINLIRILHITEIYSNIDLIMIFLLKYMKSGQSQFYITNTILVLMKIESHIIDQKKHICIYKVIFRNHDCENKILNKQEMSLF